MILGKNPSLLEVKNAARIVAATGVNTMLLGESGTGRNLLARFIHAKSIRSSEPFISVNCASLSPDITDALLFGSVAHDEKTSGQILAADKGTLYLDGISDLPLDAQAKLLRFLESGEILPVGSATPVTADVRIIAASHPDLSSKVDKGEFRQDLYYRLNVVPLELPPLRERQGDIPMLLAHFLKGLSDTHGLKAPRFNKSALECMRQYHWPGNIRELKNVCERLLILLPGQVVSVQNLPSEMTASQSTDETIGSKVLLPPEGIVLASVEESLIRQALDHARGNRSKAARLLGISRDTLLYRLKKFAIV